MSSLGCLLESLDGLHSFYSFTVHTHRSLDIHVQLLIKRLATLTLGLLVEVEGQSFEKRLQLFLPLLHNCISLYDPQAPEGVMEGTETSEEVESDEEDEKAVHNVESNGTMDGTENGESEMDVEQSATEVPSEKSSKLDSQKSNVGIMDQLLFSCLTTLRKICTECSVLRCPTHCETMNMIWSKYITTR